MSKQPKFEAQEKYLIESVMSDSNAGSDGFFAFSYLFVGVVVAAWGAFNASAAAVFAGLAVVTFGRIQEWNSDRQWRPVWRSILGKYAEAVKEDDEG